MFGLPKQDLEYMFCTAYAGNSFVSFFGGAVPHAPFHAPVRFIFIVTFLNSVLCKISLGPFAFSVSG